MLQWKTKGEEKFIHGEKKGRAAEEINRGLSANKKKPKKPITFFSISQAAAPPPFIKKPDPPPLGPSPLGHFAFPAAARRKEDKKNPSFHLFSKQPHTNFVSGDFLPWTRQPNTVGGLHPISLPLSAVLPLSQPTKGSRHPWNQGKPQPLLSLGKTETGRPIPLQKKKGSRCSPLLFDKTESPSLLSLSPKLKASGAPLTPPEPAIRTRRLNNHSILLSSNGKNHSPKPAPSASTMTRHRLICHLRKREDRKVKPGGREKTEVKQSWKGRRPEWTRSEKEKRKLKSTACDFGCFCRSRHHRRQGREEKEKAGRIHPFRSIACDGTWTHAPQWRGAWRRRAATAPTFPEVLLCISWMFRGPFCNFYMLEHVFKITVSFFCLISVILRHVKDGVREYHNKRDVWVCRCVCVFLIFIYVIEL